MPWQRAAVDVALEIDPDTGLYHYGIVVVTVQRQAGKTKLESDVADHRCLTTPRGRVWITQQTGKDASSWMRDEHFTSLEAASSIFGPPGSPSCRYRLSKRAGEIGVEWPRIGSTFRAFPPTRDALHGRQSDLVFVDEAWSFTVEQGAAVRQAVRPTMATRRGSQLWIVSTMGDDASEFFDGYVQLGLESLALPNARVCLIDYGIPDDVDPEDLSAIAAAHPAYGHTVDLAALEAARADFGGDVAGWARAYGNRASRTRETAVSAAVWAAAARPRQDIPDRAGIAVDATPSGAHVAIMAAWRDPAGHGWLEKLYAGPPTRDLPAVLSQLAHRYAGGAVHASRDGIGALELLDAAARHDRRLDVKWLTVAEHASACGVLNRGLHDEAVHHSNDPDLDAAIEIVTKRPVGDGGFVWGRAHSLGSIAEVVGAGIALYAYDRLPAPKRKPALRA